MSEKYEAAMKLQTSHTRNAVHNGNPVIQWEKDGRHFSYMREVEQKDGNGWDKVPVRVDGVSGAEEFLSGVPEEKDASAVTRYQLLTRDHNLILLDRETNRETQLTSDGEEWCEYGCYTDIYSQITVTRTGKRTPLQVLWSPDRRHFVIFKADRRRSKKLYLLESWADSASEIRPVLHQYPCPFPADPDEEIPHYTLYAGDVERKKLCPVQAPEFLYPVTASEEKTMVRWLEDGSGFYFTWIARGYQEARLYLGNTDGTVRLLVRETTDRFLNLGAFGLLDGYGAYQFSNAVTTDRKYAFWQSERSGYAHLYRYEIGAENNPAAEDDSVSVGGTDLFDTGHRELIVQKLVRVDEEQECIYFMGNNDADCSDPLYYQLYRIGFDGTGLLRLTPEDAVHKVSMGRDAFVDTYSRVDLPPTTVVRRLDGTLVRNLEQADVRELQALGYQYPERFTVTAGDGVTKLYGIMIRPADFDPERTYPVIDYVYGGAQLYNVPRDFTWDNAMNREIFGGLQSLAKLGFAGIILDGRGTPGRGMDFHAFSYRNIQACAGLEDHVTSAGELKEKYPFLDLERVGIWGNSAGGYATVTGLFQYPDFYKVGVAASGNYDQRMYEHSWTERYYGRYDETVYQQGDITAMADRLSGKLLLAYGAMDDNVTMSQTLRLCDRLNQCGKYYDLMVLPRTNHNVPSNPYFVQRKIDFFLQHL